MNPQVARLSSTLGLIASYILLHKIFFGKTESYFFTGPKTTLPKFSFDSKRS
jgi:hypothetical protein